MSASVPLRSLLADPAMACAGYVAERERAEYLYAAQVLPVSLGEGHRYVFLNLWKARQPQRPLCGMRTGLQPFFE